MIKKNVPFSITFMSLVGINDNNYPLLFGNYCGLGGYYCVNMWAENINEFRRRNPDMTDVEVVVFGNLCVVVDERIPKEWRSSFCRTGCSVTAGDLKGAMDLMERPYGNEVCGCEKDDVEVCISSCASLNVDQKGYTWIHTCHNCGRKFDNLGKTIEVKND